MKKYSAGFLFSDDTSKLLLIRKNKPDWQKDKLNAIGGKVETGETYDECMEREFCEETGLTITHWQPFCLLKGKEGKTGNPEFKGEDFRVMFYVAYSDKIFEATSPTDEEVELVNTSYVKYENIMKNLSWLIPMAISGECFEIEEK